MHSVEIQEKGEWKFHSEWRHEEFAQDVARRLRDMGIYRRKPEDRGVRVGYQARVRPGGKP